MMKTPTQVSVVIPVFNEEGNIAALAEALDAALTTGGEDYPSIAIDGYELIFVDDGSGDRSLFILRGLAAKDRRIRYISFSRNFGHQAALRAGLEAAGGECVVMMDGDFQHPPSLVPALIAEYERGFDIVATKRVEPNAAAPSSSRLYPAKTDAATMGYQDRTPLVKRLTSRLFYALANKLSDTKLEPGSADFRLLSRRARDVLLSMKEHNLFLRGAIPWTGLPSTEISYTPDRRRSGETKYTLSKMLSLALDGITSFSVKPLRLTSFAGIFISGLGFVYALYALVIRLATDRTVEGWTSILISVLIIGGIQLICLGIIGEYLGKLFMETKGRPHYVVKEASPSPCREDRGDRT